ncbi:hypothetical protein K227x_64030 [Rubripirellula lacrimiformis]|uniref:Putative phage metallopeptidase domain-containing protein n=1 Tax=Rubripirellula lacrimiformis TaxID=1930273 RepID=A0A517NLM9_9BACT|nr:putative metallopeptidase [Rubripirellula lacrimiformis]QDT07973.1 hypothetical protein K227x_64030 [Rubripirellula lacrimiformis]
MGKTYEKAPALCRRLVGELLTQFHQPLADFKTVIDILLVRASRDADGQPIGPALQGRSGYPAAASVSVTKLKDRVMGRGDAEILIDGDRYTNWTEKTLRAILDHELEHLEFTGNVDDLGRPKFRLRPHDVEFGWFDSIARRHGDDSGEVLQAKRFFGAQPIRQLYLPGWEDGPPAVDPDAIKPSLSRTKAAAHFRDLFDEVDPKTLMYAAVPYESGGETSIVEAWVDKTDRAVIFTAGKVIDITPHLQLSARWAKREGGNDGR